MIPEEFEDIAVDVGISPQNISYIPGDQHTIQAYAVSENNCKQLLVDIVMQNPELVDCISINKTGNSEWPYTITYELE